MKNLLRGEVFMNFEGNDVDTFLTKSKKNQKKSITFSCLFF